eukprot:12993219-Alexandrium_andersonii.AAC.1
MLGSSYRTAAKAQLRVEALGGIEQFPAPTLWRGYTPESGGAHWAILIGPTALRSLKLQKAA